MVQKGDCSMGEGRIIVSIRSKGLLAGIEDIPEKRVFIVEVPDMIKENLYFNQEL